MQLRDGGGLTLDQLARTGHPPEVLRTVLADELQRRRVRHDPLTGEYRLVADRFDPGTLAALVWLGERWNGPAARGPARASRLGRCSGCGWDFDSRSVGCSACSERFRNRRRRRSPLPYRAA
jgi:hypothetical protein